MADRLEAPVLLRACGEWLAARPRLLAPDPLRWLLAADTYGLAALQVRASLPCRRSLGRLCGIGSQESRLDVVWQTTCCAGFWQQDDVRLDGPSGALRLVAPA